MHCSTAYSPMNKTHLNQRKIVHIDMDCFYAAIEMRDNPGLADKPVAAGGTRETRGVLATCNYRARQYGLHAAMSTYAAFKHCPDLVLLPVNMEKYRHVSREIKTIFHDYTPYVEPLSLDEAYLDVTQCDAYQGSATLIAQDIRQRILTQHQFTASAGVAPNKFLAKISSDWHKPNGQLVITPNKVAGFIEQLQIGRIHGVGKATQRKLARLNVATCQDLQTLTRTTLAQHFGAFGEKLYLYARGINPRPVEPNRIRKSVSV